MNELQSAEGAGYPQSGADGAEKAAATDFARKPIIVLGVNHSGTRVVVDMLSVLGSDGGDTDNRWRENKFFLGIHEKMMGAVDDPDWTSKIYGLDFIRRLTLDEGKKQSILTEIKHGLAGAYPHHETRPWHWKCPTSALFMDFWLETYPDAYYVHIVRDPLKVAQSLVSRKSFYTVRSALRFYQLMEQRLAAASSAKHYLKLDYGRLREEVPRLVEFMPFLDATAVDRARALIGERPLRWNPAKSLRHNLWVYSTAARVTLARALRGRQWGEPGPGET